MADDLSSGSSGKNKLSGAQGRKRRAAQAEEVKNSSKFMRSYFTLTVKEGGKENDDNSSEDKQSSSQSTELSEQDESDPSDVLSETPSLPNGAEVLETCDVGFLRFDNQMLPVVPQNLCTEMVSLGSEPFQHKDGPFEANDKDGRAMTKSWFKRKLLNGQEVNRSWLLYSPSRRSAYCFCCLLYSSASENTRSSFELGQGFNSWKKTEKLSAHENSVNHRLSFRSWKETQRRIKEKATIDANLEEQINKEKENWRQVLKRILDCIKFLACQNLALRGHIEKLELVTDMNVGNFLSLLNLVSRYDPILKQHLEYALRNKLLQDIRKNKYYGMLFDSTPDLGHREQMSQVFRYVDIDFERTTVEVKEVFLGFIHIHGKTASHIENCIVERLETDEINLQDCRSQCYDNAAVMSGHLSGVQQRISARNPKATFVNCDNHSLNLCGVHAASQEPIVITFFGTVASIYAFFSRSTLRWERLKEVLPIVVKRESDTRWSARADAVKAIHQGIEPLLELLEKFGEDEGSTPETRGDAVQLQQAILSFNFLTLLHFWKPLLSKINRVQKRMQDPTMNFQDAYLDIKALQENLSEEREAITNEAVEKGEEICKEQLNRKLSE